MDIILLAAIALYIFYKLTKQFGKIDDEERKQIEERIAKRRAEILAKQNAAMKPVNPSAPASQNSNVEVADQASEKIFSTLDEANKKNLTNILQACKISAEFFVKGAESAFEMIIKAFAAGDLETLKFLLSEKIYQGFESAINQRKTANQTLTTNIISIDKAEIISALQMGNLAAVVMKFVSKQINYITDQNGQVIQGKKSEISELTDIWTFKKDVTSKDPNWIVSATSK
jgi:predicted lipid-binding transport protein (Tim44 family)